LGNFTLENLEHGKYTLHFSFIGSCKHLWFLWANL
jgi:hypothetical protein